ncbi:hypothetical protein Belba_1585 [Belliella baltica DSM 15883]|uniref:DUF5640 domain-containing protein n=1 Tax=Belliella baltica (strain DSM 15883 / CIP 108006 / LMG 21964 / BA134) TaxID=866536 RepID=I3Z4M4_BELBD|nr:hypothetical protein [Belliella baltica]AFL84192.1 hypothetical protein Belba_1585 [Belliella baltica DSM 15883]
MKRIKLLVKVIVPITVVALLVGFKLFFYQQDSDESLLGKYVSTDDPNWVWEFKSDGKLNEYYEGELSDVYYYSIEKTSPQCGFEVDEGPLFKYLVRKNVVNTSEQYCYEIYSMGNEYLQLRYLGGSGFFSFKKTN